MTCSSRSCSVLSSAQKQGSPDLPDRPREGFMPGGQVGRGSEQSDLVGDVPTCGRGLD